MKWLRRMSTGAVSAQDRRAAIKRLIGRCPVCLYALDRHETAILALEVVPGTRQGKPGDVLSLIEDGRWEDACRIRDGIVSENDLREYRLLRCPFGGLALLGILYWFDLYKDDCLELSRVLVDVDDDGVFRDLVDNSGQICAERYAGVEHLQQHCFQPAEFSGQKTAVMVRRAAKQPAEPSEMCVRSVRGARFRHPEHA